MKSFAFFLLLVAVVCYICSAASDGETKKFEQRVSFKTFKANYNETELNTYLAYLINLKLIFAGLVKDGSYDDQLAVDETVIQDLLFATKDAEEAYQDIVGSKWNLVNATRSDHIKYLQSLRRSLFPFETDEQQDELTFLSTLLEAVTKQLKQFGEKVWVDQKAIDVAEAEKYEEELREKQLEEELEDQRELDLLSGKRQPETPTPSESTNIDNESEISHSINLNAQPDFIVSSQVETPSTLATIDRLKADLEEVEGQLKKLQLKKLQASKKFLRG